MRAYLEITNCCNRSCSFCPGTRRKPCFASPEQIRSRLKKLDHVDELCLHLMGEPLLHPQFREIADLCSQRGIPVTLTTNGTLLDPEKSQILLKNPIFRQINFSLQALAPGETQELDKILDFCRTALEQRPELYLNLRMWNLQKDFSIPDRDQNFLYRIFHAFQLDVPQTLAFHEKYHCLPLKGRLYLHCAAEFDWPVENAAENPGYAFCHGPGTQFGILADGTVVPCCLDSDGTIALGNLDEQSLEEILHSPRAKAIRCGFLRGKAVEDLCRRCTFRNRFRKR